MFIITTKKILIECIRYSIRMLIMFTIIITYIFFILWLMLQLTSASYWNTLFHLLPGSFRNDDTNRNIYELIESRGFKYEQHFVETNDGYILQLVRIINPLIANDDEHYNRLKPILLHHGFQCTGTSWLIARNGTLLSNGIFQEYSDEHESTASYGNRFNSYPTKDTVGDSLGFVLATKGYDVWLANYRGSIYSTNHTRLRTDSSEFWKFSIDEMILYDLPAEIDYILEKTQRKSLSYIGHSQGNLMMFGLMSLSDYYSERIRPFIALSPVFYHDGGIRSALTRFIPFIDYLRSNPSMVPFSSGTRSFFSNVCENILTKQLCFNMFYQFTGTIMDNINPNRLTVFTSNIGMGSSSWNAAHLLQLYKRLDGNFTSFDMGDSVKNLDRYGQSEPFNYDASIINSTNIALIYTENDWFNTIEQIERLRKTLPKKLIDDYLIPNEWYGHVDLLWGYNVGKMVNQRILNILNHY
ncbi:Alpha/beta-hydrolase lipase region [Dermatophagoides pteronyssinus]|uniref:Alpha/beta-hydrolase lipase region n=1 Tax=Dermatophagoides pteronyssinus TaxID=6956 RepID=A0ABQ8JUK3_DERPT|nr:Alpha/beta-hydrolase lipase region [Dermatophagoides pteronyssinus]